MSDALGQWRCADNYIEELQIELDEAQRRGDEVQEDCVHGESQQLADAQERIRELEKDLADTGVELRGEWIKVERITHDLMGRLRQVEELQEEMRKVEGSTHKLDQEKSKLNKRIEEEQISNSRNRKSLRKNGK